MLLLRPKFLGFMALSGLLAPAPVGPADAEAERQQVLREGLALYEVERASWVSDDVLRAQPSLPLPPVTFLSYPTPDSVRTVFIAVAGNQPTVVLQVSYAKGQLQASQARARQTGRPLTEQEEKLFLVQQDVLKRRRKLTDNQSPAGTTYNVAVLDQGTAVKAYLLLGATTTGVVPLGADFCLTYGPDGKLQRTQKLHQSYVPLTPPPAGATVQASMHTHLPGFPGLITATDICTLLLYREALPPTHQRHVVLGAESASVFELETQELRAVPRQEFEQNATP
ncbi:hypothetical protein D3Y59_03585 [Hymenobacter oligotrophus]|uniref:Uncharacterized protein n=1 Tax=Hymenobacter oligotrophus TaxID=2319843 RepID=A0A3B7QXF5_9BACT|nr:hypothetical protein [Hymenobacter oligotrophus]AYA36225.1 hypothetical protein D3Y59_03585 [Hymenobacter oligotrophus]